MKYLIFTACFFACFTLSAQEIAAVETNTNTELLQARATVTTVSEETVATHNKMAHGQISDFLSENLSYPDKMKQFGLDGTVTAGIVFSSKGKIGRVNIARTDLPEAFHQELMMTLLMFEQLELKGNRYLGDGVIYVQVRFNL